jgi:hypothetical protein
MVRLGAERFDYVIVGTDLQPYHAIDFRISGAEENQIKPSPCKANIRVSAMAASSSTIRIWGMACGPVS